MFVVSSQYTVRNNKELKPISRISLPVLANLRLSAIAPKRRLHSSAVVAPIKLRLLKRVTITIGLLLFLTVLGPTA